MIRHIKKSPEVIRLLMCMRFPLSLLNVDNVAFGHRVVLRYISNRLRILSFGSDIPKHFQLNLHYHHG